MDPMLASFISETRDNLETAGRCFLGLEKAPDDNELMDELFRSVHTIKGSSGLFELPHFTAAVHIAEDLLDKARANEFTLDSESIDVFLDTFDYIRDCIDELESDQEMSAQSIATATTICEQLKRIQQVSGSEKSDASLSEKFAAPIAGEKQAEPQISEAPSWIKTLSPQDSLSAAKRLLSLNSHNSDSQTDYNELVALQYTPASDCFFAGEDPLHLVMQTPGLLHFVTEKNKVWDELGTLDPFKCNLRFYLIAALDKTAETDAIAEHFKYIPDQIERSNIDWHSLIQVCGEQSEISRFRDSIAVLSDALDDSDNELAKNAAQSIADLSDEDSIIHQYSLWLCLALSIKAPDFSILRTLLNHLESQSSEFTLRSNTSAENNTNALNSSEPAKGQAEARNNDTTNKDITVLRAMLPALQNVLHEQIEMLGVTGPANLLQGKLASVIAFLECSPIQAMHSSLIRSQSMKLLFEELHCNKERYIETSDTQALIKLISSIIAALDEAFAQSDDLSKADEVASLTQEQVSPETAASSLATSKETDKISKTGAKDKTASKVLRVDQSRIDSLMDLVGELIVAKNALPYLAKRAEEEFGSRVLAKEIKSQYSGLDRLADELQSAVMHIRLVPMTSVFQRFPRLVRDLSRKLGKQINLQLEGEDTEADKTIVEELSDPLIHLVRNSLDHGLETSEDRAAAGKSAVGTLILRAIPKDDQVLIEVQDDGKGIDPSIIKHKAYTKGIIDEDRLESISDQEALQLIFAPGFSTAEQISDLSGRGVGMDVVKTVINQTGGTVLVESEVGVGTTIRLSLPLSMAVSRVMMLELHEQLYGISMDKVAETVRLEKKRVQSIKNKRAFVLRENLIPLFSLSQMLGMPYEIADETEELAIMVVNTSYGQIGVVIDEFHEGIDIIQKPLAGVMSGYPFYSGTALLGDGRVLLVLNMEELVACQ